MSSEVEELARILQDPEGCLGINRVQAGAIAVWLKFHGYSKRPHCAGVNLDDLKLPIARFMDLAEYNHIARQHNAKLKALGKTEKG